MSRLTLCNFAVDETVDEQRKDHRLREASFCGRCVVRAARSGLPIEHFQYAFTEKGRRRHMAHLAQTL